MPDGAPPVAADADRGAWLDPILDRLDGIAAGLMFGLRIWLAMVLALGVAFWLQLESAATAAVTVGILAVPTRGQVLSKALYRLGGTLLGFVVSLALAALFGQDRIMMLVFAGLWISGCVFVASYAEGSRAYGAAISGFSVAMIALANIDQPGSIFEIGIERTTAMAIGVLAIAIVNDLLRAPNSVASVGTAIRVTRDAVRRITDEAASGQAPPRHALVALCGKIAPARLNIQGLVAESLDGRDRASGASLAVTALAVQTLAAADLARAVALCGPDRAASVRGDVSAALAGDRAAALRLEARAVAALADPGASPDHVRLHRRAVDVVTQDGRVADGLAALDGKRPAAAHASLPVVRDFSEALRNAARVAIAYAIASVFYIQSGWPATSEGMLLISSTSSMAAINPAPAAFAHGLLTGIPIVLVASAFIKFGLLDGGQGLPLLAVGMAPVIIAGGVLMSNARTLMLGFIMVVFFPVLFSPSNPQSFDPNSLISSGTILLMTAILLALSITYVLPTSVGRRRRWAFGFARARLGAALAGDAVDPGRRGLKDATRLAAFAAQCGRGRAGGRVVARGAALVALDVSVVDANRALARLATHAPFAPAVAEARAALERVEPAGLRRAAERLLAEGLHTPPDLVEPASHAVASLATAADVMRQERPMLRRLRHGAAA